MVGGGWEWRVGWEGLVDRKKTEHFKLITPAVNRADFPLCVISGD